MELILPTKLVMVVTIIILLSLSLSPFWQCPKAIVAGPWRQVMGKDCRKMNKALVCIIF